MTTAVIHEAHFSDLNPANFKLPILRIESYISAVEFPCKRKLIRTPNAYFQETKTEEWEGRNQVSNFVSYYFPQNTKAYVFLWNRGRSDQSQITSNIMRNAEHRITREKGWGKGSAWCFEKRVGSIPRQPPDNVESLLSHSTDTDHRVWNSLEWVIERESCRAHEHRCEDERKKNKAAQPLSSLMKLG